jgi:hypothetical protein
VSFQLLAAPPPPPGPVDLDRVEAEAGQFVPGGWVARTVPGLVAELRAAREALRLAPRPVLNYGTPRQGVTLLFDRAYVDALAAYDRAVSEP